ncbi:hypothetical protein V6246_04550 [Algibacter sp. TI.3.09]|uniref:hypothetical protein n=1 Tax=Algibacter sp. TI.3.09 TaxID=3121298 RepID=UPI00311DF1A9
MIQAKHCDLCEFPKRNLKTGLHCGLTDKKPDFKVSCSKIKFSKEFKNYLPELQNQIEKLKKRKTSVYVKFLLTSTIGLIVIFKSHSLLEIVFKMELSYSSWRYFEDTYLIYLVGAAILSIALRPILQYKKALKDLKSEKTEINTVINKYNLNIESLINRDKK